MSQWHALAAARRRLSHTFLALDVFSDIAFGRKLRRRLADYPCRVAEVLAARARRRNPPMPPWWRRETARWLNHAPLQTIGQREEPVRLFAVVAVWNEDDVIYATVANTLEQGADRCFVLDDGSSDRTAEEAAAAGAVVRMLPARQVYDELGRSSAIQDLIREQTEAVGGSVWWLVVDADEFPRGPSTLAIKDFVEMLPPSTNVVGSRVLEHVPDSSSECRARAHPLRGLRSAYWHATPYCPKGHWKHQLFRTHPQEMLLPLPGHHVIASHSCIPLHEASDSLLMHHFPMRDRTYTEEKYRRLALPDSRYSRSPDSFTLVRLAQRRAAIGLHYADRHESVGSGLPGHAKGAFHPVDWRLLVPESERNFVGSDWRVVGLPAASGTGRI